MPFTATQNTTVTIAGITTAGTITRTASGSASQDTTLATAKTGTLSVRTDNDTGTITLDPNHGLTTGTYDVYWTVGGVNGARYGMTATITTNSAAIDAGTGDNLPIATSPVVLAPRVTLDMDFSGSLVKAIAINLGTTGIVQRGRVDFQNNAGTSLIAFTLNGGEPFTYITGDGTTNQFDTLAVGKVIASQSSSL